MVPQVNFLEYSSQRNIGKTDWIVAERGMGKTFLLNELKRQWQNLQANQLYNWVFIVDLTKISNKTFTESTKFEDFLVKRSPAEDKERPWISKALEHDIKNGGILLLLDAWDQVKPHLYKDVQVFLSKIPLEVSCLIATRSDGLNSFDFSRFNENYFLLRKLDEKLIKEYVEKFFTEQYPGQLSEDNLSQIALEIQGWLADVGSKFSKVLGTPLQISQLCEILSTRLKTNPENNLLEWFYYNKPLELATLFQEFVFSAFHKLDPRSTEIFYDCWDKHLNFLSIEAYRQLFNKSDEWREKYHKLDLLSPPALKNLHKTGIVEQINSDSWKKVKYKFNNQAYTEYFGALYILRAFFRNHDDLLSEVVKDINHNKYLEYYKTVFIFAFQLSLNDHPLLPQYQEDQEELVTWLWNILLNEEPKDMFGRASMKLFSACIDSLTKEQLDRLSFFLPNEYHSDLRKFRMSAYKNINARNLQLLLHGHRVNQAPGSFSQLKLPALEEEFQVEGKEDVRSSLKDQKKALRFTQEFIEKHPEDMNRLAGCFKKLGDLDYSWGMNGGFQAMALLGDYFDEDHARYFEKIMMSFPQLPHEPAIKALVVLVENSPSQKTLKQVISIILCIKHHFGFVNNLEHIFKKNPLLLIKCLLDLCSSENRDLDQLADLIRLIVAIACFANYCLILDKNTYYLITGYERLDLSNGSPESNQSRTISELLKGYQAGVNGWHYFISK